MQLITIGHTIINITSLMIKHGIINIAATIRMQIIKRINLVNSNNVCFIYLKF